MNALNLNFERYIVKPGFRERFLYLQNEKNVYIKEVAESIGIDRSTLSKIVSGKTKLKEEMQKKLADYFDVDIAYLIGESNIRRANNNIHGVYLEVLEGFDPSEIDPEELKEVLEIYKKMKGRKK